MKSNEVKCAECGHVDDVTTVMVECDSCGHYICTSCILSTDKGEICPFCNKNN